MSHLLLAAAVAALTPPLAGAPSALPDGNPALWVVGDADTTIYLFGTFHALDGKTDWFNDQVAAAFDESDELVLETLVPQLPRLKPAASFRPVGPMTPVAGSASFLSGTKMVMSAGKSQGMSTSQGADTILRDAADATGKPVGGLESFEFQLGMFSRLPQAPKSASRAQQAATMQALSSVLTQLQAAWNEGDAEIFTPMLSQMQANSPDMYQMMFAERNTRWADWIAKRLEQPGTVFVAVGAGHFAGPDRVQAKLARLGLGSARLN